MRKLRIIEHVSLDGIIQSPGSPDEDRENGFQFGGWSVPIEDSIVGEAVVHAHGSRFDLLLGRKVYDLWADYWPGQEGAMADSINAATKYVATHRPESLNWGPAEGLGSDIVKSIKNLKAECGPDIVTWGSSTIAPVLLENELADEIILITYPVMLGSGKRLFVGAAPQELSLVLSKTGDKGVIYNIFRPAGALRTASYS